MSAPTEAPERGAEDVGIVHAIARGDVAALAALYDRYAGLMLSLAYRIVGSAEEAEDVIHDVFLEAWRHAADYDATRGSVRAWLMLRTRSRALDVQRSPRVARHSNAADEGWLAELSDPEAERGFAPDQLRVRRILISLPQEQREVLLLGYFEGLSSSEIAERVGIPVGTVKSRVAAALHALRAALADRSEEGA